MVFRTDASLQIGTGHVMRCLTLADELRRRGHLCEFFCRPHQGHLGEVISTKGFPVRWLRNAANASIPVNGQLLAYSHWLAASWQADAEQTLEAFEGIAVDWLVVDHYALDHQWEAVVGVVASHVMVIDDLADRRHHCDLLLDQNVLGEQNGDKYAGITNQSCKYLLGPAYALLGQEYALITASLPDRADKVARVLVFVGGSDPYHLTEAYLTALSAPGCRYLSADIVLGKNHQNSKKIQQLASIRGDTGVYCGLPSLAGLMVRADLMLGGGGATNWERFCLGLPAIVTSVADNQDSLNKALAQQGLICFLGKAEHVTVNDISRGLGEILDDPTAFVAQSRRVRSFVDGKGTGRVADMMNIETESGRCRV
ncbi:UDP-2,4-diacetamido-2,4,6-trideoxy-beta-L-altropyranose hydrolase [Marinobacter sp. LV10MA510-1]|uniref:UDP-2,4-diacetamido-2,4, 6-trideoxy-beta-L-altropyranose hydrolase n=1 Tax=Marinobacter sp. LV10MA510-1 TaxID=1415567 RepID=UPI001E51B110|nr:UDP-2,4-diacetamido-2,4,6-trideoxy-beta-L-altropyranose hydrolase [Marinobacter sp. LV10MA510-1]